MINIKRKKKCSANSGKFIQKSICHEHSILSLNNSVTCVKDVTKTKNCNNNGIISEAPYYFFNLTLSSTYKSLAKCSKLIRTYYIVLFQFAVVLADESLSSQEGMSSHLDVIQNLKKIAQVGENVTSFVDKISSSCQNIFGTDSSVCNNPHYAISLFFFLISTFFSILFGLLNRVCCHCVKRSRARRKRNKIIQEKEEEQKYEMELLQRQMKLLQMQQQKMYQQQIGPFTPIPVIMQGAAAQDKEKKKNSKNDKLNSMNSILKVGYNAS
ncbi:hypothetical protein, conserved [Plasmodium vivax]|uniref:Uncharacterized protein n=1 Tax=Plasmodium vivax TaxID=5855 RepID=A0A1G4HC64_PLAVI|nr:hypothetical protein, conserved [Plasmodium vivax]